MTDTTELELSLPEDAGDEVTRCRDLVALIFRAVLHREPEEADAEAFTNALLAEMPVYDFVSELMSTPEFSEKAAPTRVPSRAPSTLSPTPVTLPDILNLSLQLLQGRLGQKGCIFQLGPSVELTGDDNSIMQRMEYMVRTLAMLDVM